MNVQTLADGGDPLFRWVLGSSMLLLMPFQALVVLSPRVETAEAQFLDHASALVVGVIRLPPPQAIVLPPPPAPQPAPPAPSPSVGPVAGAPAPTVPGGGDTLVGRVVGTRGIGDPDVDDILAFDADDAERLAIALETINGAELASRAPQILRRGGSPRGPVTAVALTVAEVGGATIGEGAAVPVVAPNVEAQGGDVRTESGEASDIARVLGGRKGAVESCTQAALKKDPATRGRIGVAWSIQRGRVYGSALTANSTGSPELGACLLRVVQRTRFDASLTASVDEWAWVVSGG